MRKEFKKSLLFKYGLLGMRSRPAAGLARLPDGQVQLTVLKAAFGSKIKM
ncbi:MAG: hypothetical protein WD555_04025 [Fulvivirga sp.]